MYMYVRNVLPFLVPDNGTFGSTGLNIVPKGVVTICAESKQVFNCTYGDNDSFHRFLLNSTDASVYNSNGVDFTDMSNAHMMMLSVPGVQEFNNTNVSCKSQSDQSGPTLLIVQGMLEGVYWNLIIYTSYCTLSQVMMK